MGWHEELQRAKGELKQWAERRLAQLFVYTLTAKGSPLGDTDTVESADEGRDPGAPDSEKKGQRSVVRINPFGFNSVRPKGIRGLTLRLGMSNLFFVGIGPTTAYGPQDLGSGDAALYSSGAAQVRATGDDVVVNGGSAKVGRVGDGVDMGKWKVTLGTGPLATCIIAISWTPPGGGTPVVLAVATPGPFALTGKISSGADHFKG